MSVRFGSDVLERRMSLEARVSLSDDRKIRGMAVVFNSRSVDLGGFKEIVKPEAVDRTINENADVLALVDHDTGKVIGRVSAGTLVLRKDRAGLKVAIDPANTSAGRDIVELVGRGDVTGMSFGFRVLDDEWHMEDGLPIREVTDMEIREVSIVAFPAYEATSVSIASRSALATFEAEQRKIETAVRLRMAR